MKVSSYKELIAYQKSYEVVQGVYQLTRSFPASEQYGITSQLRRAAVSVPSNIAEGYMRGSREYVRFLKIALGSAAEVSTLLDLSLELDYCQKSDFEIMSGNNTEAMKLLTTYINRLSSD